MIKYLELFSGGGGLGIGPAKDEDFKHVVSVEWEKHAIDSAKNFFSTKYNEDPEMFIRFDVSRVKELLYGFKDPEYGNFVGIKNITDYVDVILGGPPCQAYSVAGRTHYKKNENDPKNILFESYLEIANNMNASYFIFENVPGMLSAKIGNKKIVDLIIKDARKKGYVIDSDFKSQLFDTSEFGVPQKRRRIILFGVKEEIFKKNPTIIKNFIKNLNSLKTTEKSNVKSALKGLGTFSRTSDGKYIKKNDGEYPQLHIPRFHNDRDILIFKEAIGASKRGLMNSEFSKKLYYKYHGKKSSVHKFHVLNPNKPSTTILAHLHKDGNRFILSDQLQARTLTPREAARLQTFPDDYEFFGSQTSAFKIIGNAVPPLFSEKIIKAFKGVL